jgi:hypothetical protein
MAALLVALAVSGCVDRSPTDPAATVLPATQPKKAEPTIRYLGYARPFAANVLVTSMAALPDRLVAATLGYPDKLVEIDAEGHVSPIPVRLDAPSDAVCHLTLSPGFHPGFAQGEILVSVGPTVLRVRIDPPWVQSLSALPPEDGEITGLCFDTVGRFAFAPLVVAESGHVYRVDPNGNMQDIGDVGPGGVGPSVASSDFGTLAGHLIVAFPISGDVVALSPTGDVRRFTGWSGVTGAFAVPEIPLSLGDSDAALFVALRTGESGRIVQFSRDQVARHAGALLLTSQYASGSGLVSAENGNFPLHAWGRFLGAEVTATFVQRVAVTPVELDILPGAPDTLVWGDSDPVPVALLSSPQIDARVIDAGSALLAGAPAVPSGKSGLGQLLDVNGDAVLDLLLAFRPADMQLVPGQQILNLEATTFGSDQLRGSAVVLVVSP